VPSGRARSKDEFRCCIFVVLRLDGQACARGFLPLGWMILRRTCFPLAEKLATW